MSPREMNAQSPLVAHDPGRANRPEIDTQADTQSDTLRSGRPCDSWTPLDAKVREFLSKTHRWTPSDAGGTAETDLLIRVSLVRSQHGPRIESPIYGDTGHGICLSRVQLGSTRVHHLRAFTVCRPAPSPSTATRRSASVGPSARSFRRPPPQSLPTHPLFAQSPHLPVRDQPALPRGKRAVSHDSAPVHEPGDLVLGDRQE